jgi:hypothetical protein
VQKSKLLEDVFYDKQIERMSSLAKFPQVPEAKKELRRALRRISDTDGGLINSLISDVIDTNERCPTPAELIRRAGDMRQHNPTPMGNPNCDRCGGTGFVHSVKRVAIAGLQPYDAEVSERCHCGGPK